MNITKAAALKLINILLHEHSPYLGKYSAHDSRTYNKFKTRLGRLMVEHDSDVSEAFRVIASVWYENNPEDAFAALEDCETIDNAERITEIVYYEVFWRRAWTGDFNQTDTIEEMADQLNDAWVHLTSGDDPDEFYNKAFQKVAPKIYARLTGKDDRSVDEQLADLFKNI